MESRLPSASLVLAIIVLIAISRAGASVILIILFPLWRNVPSIYTFTSSESHLTHATESMPMASFVTGDALPYNAGVCEHASLRDADAADIGIGRPLVELLEVSEYVYDTSKSFQ
jgi:hypothetical protein